MTHIAFQKKGAPVEVEADFIVVGSGAGGGAVASGLARGGAKVAVVEAGPWRDPEHYPSSMYGTMRDMFDDWTSLMTFGRALWPVLQGRVVGGTTTINSAIVVRTPADIFQSWEKNYGFGGEALAEKVWAHQDQLEKELYVQETAPDKMGRSNELALITSQKRGVEGHVIRRNVKDCEGSGQCLQGCKKERKQSTNLKMIPEVMERGGMVLSCAPVHKIMLKGNRAVGVTGRFVHPQTKEKGAKFVVRAKHGVVVAASCTHSPALLQRSGVKGRMLGQLFRAHPGSAILGLYDDDINMPFGATQGWSSLAYRNTPGFKLETLNMPLELIAGRISGGGMRLMDRLKNYRRLALWVVACRADSIGTVSNGPFGKPIVKYTMNQTDMAKLRDGAVEVAKHHFAAGAKAVMPGVLGVPYELHEKDLHHLENASLDPRAWTSILTHLFGGCPMGANPDVGLCDERGRVFGYEGLVVADASVMPTNLGVNPQHTIMGLARQRAAELLEDIS